MIFTRERVELCKDNNADFSVSGMDLVLLDLDQFLLVFVLFSVEGLVETDPKMLKILHLHDVLHLFPFGSLHSLQPEDLDFFQIHAFYNRSLAANSNFWPLFLWN